MNQDDSEICILPPFNNLHAQVIAGARSRTSSPPVRPCRTRFRATPTRSARPTSGPTSKPSSASTSAPNIGLTGNGLSGTMTPTGNGDWAATGIPLTPLMDDGTLNPYAARPGSTSRAAARPMATTQAVVPVSWEISCNLCHNRPGFAGGGRHPRSARPSARHQPSEPEARALCASCHADPALGTAGVPGVSSMSSAMHTAHATRFTDAVLPQVGGINCYACHPGHQDPVPARHPLRQGHPLRRLPRHDGRRGQARAARPGSTSRSAPTATTSRATVRRAGQALQAVARPQRRDVRRLPRLAPRHHPDRHRQRQRPGDHHSGPRRHHRQLRRLPQAPARRRLQPLSGRRGRGRY